MQLKEKLKKLRNARGVTPAQVARNINATLVNYKNWEKGSNILYGKTIIKLIEYFGINPDYLLDEKTTEIILLEKWGKSFKTTDLKFDNTSLIKKRTLLNKSLAEMARGLELDYYIYTCYENGFSAPSPRNLYLLMNYFDVDYNYFYNQIPLKEKKRFNGALLKKLRLEKGLTYIQLINHCELDISVSSLRKYENNGVKPKREVVKKIANYFNCNEFDFYPQIFVNEESLDEVFLIPDDYKGEVIINTKSKINTSFDSDIKI